jgi:hypothetical protein
MKMFRREGLYAEEYRPTDTQEERVHDGGTLNILKSHKIS